MNDPYVITTRYVTPKGHVIRHAYGPWPTRSKAQTALRKMRRESERLYASAELARAEMHVVKLLFVV